MDTALSISTAPPDVAEALGFVQPLVGRRRRLESGAGAVDYWVGEVEIQIDKQPRTFRAAIGFGGTRRYVHLGYLQVLENFRAEFRPFDGVFSLQRVK